MSSELETLLAVSRAVAEGRDLRATLDRIACEAAHVAGARAASILIQRARDQPFDVAGAYRLGEAYQIAIERPTHSATRQPGPSWLAIEHDTQVVVEDVRTDTRYRPWRRVARAEGYRGFVSTPLRDRQARAIGTLDVYRAEPGPWPPDQLQMLALFARHAATAIQTARLIDHQRQQVHALRRLVATLEEQRHEHANRLHTIAGLIAIGEPEKARRFVDSVAAGQDEVRRRIGERVHDPTLRGLLVAQAAIAEQRGVTLRVAERSRLDGLPPGVDEATAVTILGNLVDNAVDAAAGMPAPRRRVIVTFSSNGRKMIWRVRDHGPGIPAEEREAIFDRGVSGKGEHRGVGLYLVADAVARAQGTITVRPLKEGTSVTVSFPRRAQVAAVSPDQKG